jgi:hypothetical protein
VHDPFVHAGAGSIKRSACAPYFSRDFEPRQDARAEYLLGCDQHNVHIFIKFIAMYLTRKAQQQGEGCQAERQSVTKGQHSPGASRV